MTKNVACWPRSSCVDVYAKARTSADVNIMPPVTNAFKPYSSWLDVLKPWKTPSINQNEFGSRNEM